MLEIEACQIQARMKLIHRTAVRQGKSSHALARRDTLGGQSLRIPAGNVSRCGIAFQFIVKINHARLKGHHVSYFVYQDFHGVAHAQRRTEGPRDFIERVDFLVRALDLVISHVGPALTRLGHINFG